MEGRVVVNVENTEYTAIIKEIEDGWYMGKCEQVSGAMTQGQTIEEVIENLKDAIPLVLECDKELSQKRPLSKKRFIHRKIAVL